jgi:hypothetical protein
MNNRIKELSEAAYAHAVIYGSDYRPQTNFDRVYDEKFAELIIRECAAQCFSDQDYGNILDHFGIPFEDEEETASQLSQCPCGADGGTSCGSPHCYQLKGCNDE